MNLKKLDNSNIDRLVVPDGRTHWEVFDTELRGFYVDVLGSGRKSYRVRYRIENKTKVATIGDAALMSIDEARVTARHLLRQVKDGHDPLAEKVSVLGPTIAAFFTEMYLPYVKSYKRSWDTDESMIRNHLLPKLGQRHMGSIKPPDIAVFVEQMKAANYAPGTCNRALVLLRYGFRLAVRWSVPGVEVNPLEQIKNLIDDNKLERFLTNDQTIRLLDAVRQSESEMLQYIVLFLVYTGARKREVLDAKWQDIDWEHKTWRVLKTKSGKNRHLPLSTGALQVLKAVKDLQDATGAEVSHVFANPKTGLPYVSFFYSWNAARHRAGLPDLRVHDLRHSFASFLVNAGRSLYEVQELLGHADIRTTSRYAHLSRERLVAAVESVPLVPIGALA